jgi:hypothetical protein
MKVPEGETPKFDDSHGTKLTGPVKTQPGKNAGIKPVKTADQALYGL